MLGRAFCYWAIVIDRLRRLDRDLALFVITFRGERREIVRCEFSRLLRSYEPEVTLTDFEFEAFAFGVSTSVPTEPFYRMMPCLTGDEMTAAMGRSSTSELN